MARPSLPIEVAAKKSHLTKKEIEFRKKAESDMLSNQSIIECDRVKANKIAHAEFVRVCGLLDKIGKNDDLYGSIINRYCLLTSECCELLEQRDKIDGMCEKSENPDEYVKLMRIRDNVEKSITAKRSAMESIEKENCMTVQSALRSIPKKPEAKKSALAEALELD